MKRTVVHDMCIFVIDTELSVNGIVVFIKYTKHITFDISIHILILQISSRVGNNVASLFVTVQLTLISLSATVLLF